MEFSNPGTHRPTLFLKPVPTKPFLRNLYGLAIICLFQAALASAETWPTALAQMPFPAEIRKLNRTNCVDVMLHAFQSNATVKALIFMPGATDEFYMFRRANAVLTNTSPTLLDALNALTNQTLIRATFHPPLLLLHTDEDPLDPQINIEHQPTAAKLRMTWFVPHALYNDRDWDFVQPILAKKLKADVRPWPHMYDTWHFYRHSFAGWNLTGWEALEAVALAGKTRFKVEKKSFISLRPTLITFEGDERIRATPKAVLPNAPRVWPSPATATQNVLP